MAVYKKTYRPYEGELTSSWSRFLVIPRYALADLRSSRFLSLFFIGSFIYPLICALIIYVQHNASALGLLGVQGAPAATLRATPGRQFAESHAADDSGAKGNGAVINPHATTAATMHLRMSYSLDDRSTLPAR